MWLKQWFQKATQCAVKLYFPTPEPNLGINDRSGFKAATRVMLYINIAAIRLFKFNYIMVIFMVLYISSRRGNKRIINTENPGWHLVSNYKSHILLKNNITEGISRRVRFAHWREERKKRTLPWIMNNAGSSSSSGVCRECVEYETHGRTLSVC